MRIAAYYFAAAFLTVIAYDQLVRLMTSTPFVIGGITLPMAAVAVIGIVATVFAIWMVIMARREARPSRRGRIYRFG